LPGPASRCRPPPRRSWWRPRWTPVARFMNQYRPSFTNKT
jgi:hypothetical protein